MCYLEFENKAPTTEHSGNIAKFHGEKTLEPGRIREASKRNPSKTRPLTIPEISAEDLFLRRATAPQIMEQINLITIAPIE